MFFFFGFLPEHYLRIETNDVVHGICYVYTDMENKEDRL